jgi:uncharacterized protein (TIGR02231 family)
MKKLLVCFSFFFLLLFAVSSSFSQDIGVQSEIVLTSAIEKVTVYSDRAVVERSAAFDMNAGTHSYVFDNLPELVKSDSLQLKGEGPAVQEDLIFRTKYFADIPDDRIKAIQNQRDDVDSKAQAISDNLNRLNSEIEYLKKIMDKVTFGKEGQTTVELNPEKWQQMVKYHSDRLAAIDLERRELEKEQKSIKAELARIDQELGKLISGRQKKKNQAVAVLSSAKGGKVVLDLSYTVTGPSWKPTYDVRVDSEKKAVQISYNATISQNSGEDWNGVQLSLSTARAEIGGAQPDLTPWYLSLYSPQGSSGSGEEFTLEEITVTAQKSGGGSDRSYSAPKKEMKPIAAPGASAQATITAVVFNVEGKANIASDTLQHRVYITGLNLPGSFQYSTAPKLSMFAYLKANVANESAFPFLAGASKVFLDGNFVSDSSVPATSPGEKFSVFLGVDESIKVEYKLAKKTEDESGIFEKKNRFVYLFETKVTNTKKTDVELVLWDQLPMSGDKDITVKPIEPKYTKDSDKLKKTNQDIFQWFLNLKPGEIIKIPLSFSVEFPQDMNIYGLSF